MGFFGSSKKKKSPSWNIIDPPSAYTSKPPSLPYRPAQQPPPQQHSYPAPQHQPQRYPYANPQTSYSQPALLQHPSPPPPPPSRWHSEQQQQRPDSRLGISRWTSSVMDLADAAVSQVYDDVASRLDDVMTRIDREAVSASEAALFLCRGGGQGGDTTTAANEAEYDGKESASDGEALDRSLPFMPSSSGQRGKPKKKKKTSRNQESRFAKVELYANSKLPLSLPPLALYMPTWPLLCLAAQYSSQVYSSPPDSSDPTAHSSSDWSVVGTRAMCIKSVPMDHAHAIVLAIRGTSSFMDWAVNLNTSPASPASFLDDPGNLCHAGFLAVARNMVPPVAARLRQLLQDDPGRAAYSLLITGHSAGGAIAALLYMHMLATAPGTGSELNLLAGCFKRIHCVTFGAPPVSLLPLRRPMAGSGKPRRLSKCLFLAFVNEGDPVVRADKAYVKSLLELLTKPPPELRLLPEREDDETPGQQQQRRRRRRRRQCEGTATTPPELPKRRYKQVHWPVPACALSNAGRIVVLRTADPMGVVVKGRKTVDERLAEGVVAVTCEEDALRGVIWGDPVCHMMSLYAGRIETLAVAAVMGRNVGNWVGDGYDGYTRLTRKGEREIRV